jgi:hypothetical protein
MHMLTFCILLCSLALILVFLDMFKIFVKYFKAIIHLFIAEDAHIYRLIYTLTLFRSYLKPYCMGRKNAFFQRPFKCIGQQERFRAFRPTRDI